MLEDNKGRKIDDADEKINSLDDAINDLGALRDDAYKKLQIYQKMLDDGKENQGKTDPDLAEKLRALTEEAKNTIEKELKDLADQVADLKKKRSDLQRQQDDVKKSPAKFTPQQIDALVGSLDEQNGSADEIREKLRQAESHIDDKIKELAELLESCDTKNNLTQKIEEVQQAIEDDIKAFGDLLDEFPETIGALTDTIAEMQKETEPDASADYWDEKDKLKRWLARLDEIKDDLDRLNKFKQRKQAEVEALTKSEIDGLDNDGLAQKLKDYQEHLKEF